MHTKEILALRDDSDVNSDTTPFKSLSRGNSGEISQYLSTQEALSQFVREGLLTQEFADRIHQQIKNQFPTMLAYDISMLMTLLQWYFTRVNQGVAGPLTLSFFNILTLLQVFALVPMMFDLSPMYGQICMKLKILKATQEVLDARASGNSVKEAAILNALHSVLDEKAVVAMAARLEPLEMRARKQAYQLVLDEVARLKQKMSPILRNAAVAASWTFLLAFALVFSGNIFSAMGQPKEISEPAQEFLREAIIPFFVSYFRFLAELTMLSLQQSRALAVRALSGFGVSVFALTFLALPVGGYGLDMGFPALAIGPSLGLSLTCVLFNLFVAKNLKEYSFFKNLLTYVRTQDAAHPENNRDDLEQTWRYFLNGFGLAGANLGDVGAIMGLNVMAAIIAAWGVKDAPILQTFGALLLNFALWITAAGGQTGQVRLGMALGEELERMLKKVPSNFQGPFLQAVAGILGQLMLQLPVLITFATVPELVASQIDPPVVGLPEIPSYSKLIALLAALQSIQYYFLQLNRQGGDNKISSMLSILFQTIGVALIPLLAYLDLGADAMPYGGIVGTGAAAVALMWRAWSLLKPSVIQKVTAAKVLIEEVVEVSAEGEVPKPAPQTWSQYFAEKSRSAAAACGSAVSWFSCGATSIHQELDPINGNALI